MSPPSRDQLLQTTKLFLEAFNEFTAESVVRYRSPSCIQHILPTTLKIPQQTNAEYASFVDTLKTFMPGFKIQLVDGEEPVVDDVARKVVLHLKSRSETKAGLYQNEYMWILTLSQDGKSVDDVLEFADSLYTSEWLPKFQNAGAEGAKN
ncbi:hypothetical protein F4819DRAFT_473174 [Hypoxylon fuscum]|nr:hypothetical protein F4819DRAFT_473174 [Hypoxylon fuscum]